MYNENAKERHREFIEGLRKSYNLTTGNAIGTAETLKKMAQNLLGHVLLEPSCCLMTCNDLCLSYWQSISA